MRKELENIKRDEHMSATSEEADILSSTDPDVQRRLRRISILWLTDSTSRILPKIFQKKHPYIRFLWIVFFIVSGTMSLALVIKYFKDYLEYRVNVNVQVIYESPTIFPAVTFCNLNPFYRKRIQDYANSILARNNLTERLLKNETAITRASRMSDLLRVSTTTELSAEQRTLFGFDIDEILISCSYNNVKCGPGNFSLSQSYYYGNCYTFNSGKNANGTPSVIQKTSISGINSGLQLEIYVGDPFTSELYNHNSGLHMVIHNQTTKPMIDVEGIEVSTGVETNIAVKRTFITKLGSPYNKCKVYFMQLKKDTLHLTLYQRILQEFNATAYHQKQCFNLCYQVKIVDDCNCTDPRFAAYPVLNTTEISALEPCKNSTQLDCMSKSIYQFQNNPISEECSNYCPQECISMYYSLSSTMSSYPTLSYSKLLLEQNEILKKASYEHLDYETLKYSMLKVNVYYEDMTYSRISESPAITADVLLGKLRPLRSLVFVQIIYFKVILVACYLCSLG